jgi:hypothetical protein
MSENGRPTSQQILNAALSVIVTLIGLLWFGVRGQVDQLAAAEHLNIQNIAEVRSDSRAFQAEVLRRLDRIEAKLDKTK